MATTVTSKQFSLNLNDLAKGVTVAFITAFTTSIYQWISNGQFPTLDQFKTAGLIGLGAAISYLLKNFLDKPKVVVTDLKQDTIDAVKDGTADVKVITK